MLCTGERGPSFAHSRFSEVGDKNTAYEFVGTVNYDNQGGASITPELEVVKEKYLHPSAPGIVFPTHGIYNASAQFGIRTGEEKGGNCIEVFGQVEVGLEILKLAAKVNDITDVEITDCGLVLSP